MSLRQANKRRVRAERKLRALRVELAEERQLRQAAEKHGKRTGSPFRFQG